MPAVITDHKSILWKAAKCPDIEDWDELEYFLEENKVPTSAYASTEWMSLFEEIRRKVERIKASAAEGPNPNESHAETPSIPDSGYQTLLGEKDEDYVDFDIPLTGKEGFIFVTSEEHDENYITKTVFDRCKFPEAEGKAIVRGVMRASGRPFEKRCVVRDDKDMIADIVLGRDACYEEDEDEDMSSQNVSSELVQALGATFAQLLIGKRSLCDDEASNLGRSMQIAIESARGAAAKGKRPR